MFVLSFGTAWISNSDFQDPNYAAQKNASSKIEASSWGEVLFGGILVLFGEILVLFEVLFGGILVNEIRDDEASAQSY